MSDTIQEVTAVLTRDDVNAAQYDKIKMMFASGSVPSVNELTRVFNLTGDTYTDNDLRFRHVVNSYALIHSNQKNKKVSSFGSLDNYFCFFDGASFTPKTEFVGMPDFLDVDLLIKRQEVLRNLLDKEMHETQSKRKKDVNSALALINELTEKLKAQGLRLDVSDDYTDHSRAKLVLYDNVTNKEYRI